ncbi:MAG: PEP-CTERM sorting domain-containing protein [Planctomycetota bacterium]
MAAATAGGCVLAGSASGAILNGSFEAGSVGDTATADGTTPSVPFNDFDIRDAGSGGGATAPFTTAELVATDVTDGSQALQITTNGAFNPFISQSRSGADLVLEGLIDGQTYTFRADFAATDTGNLGISDFFRLRVESTAGGVTTGVETPDITANGSVSIDFTFDSNADYEFMIRGGIYRGDTTSGFTTDNWQVVPEPGTAALLALGGGMIILRRREASSAP